MELPSAKIKSRKVYRNLGPVVVGHKIGDVSIVHDNATRPAKSRPIHFRVARPDLNFIGRLKELKQLKDAILSTHKPSITLVTGMGGVGKSQLVRKFISENQTSYTNFVWINAENPQLIEQEFKTLAKDMLNIKTIDADYYHKNFESVAELVLSRLSTSNTLIIYDNAYENEQIKFLLARATAGIAPHVVITSRIREWSCYIQKISLKVWETKEALDYVSTTLSNYNSDTDDDKSLLAEKLQNFPLALRQATAHIIHQRADRDMHIVDYIKKYDTREMLDSSYFIDDVFNDYKKTTFSTWSATIDVIKKCDTIGELAAKILHTIAYFDRDNIHVYIFFYHQYINEETKYEEFVRLAIRLLIKYSLIDAQTSSEVPQSIFSVHSLVQKVIKIELQINVQENLTLRDGLSNFRKLFEHEHSKIHDSHQHAISVFVSALKSESVQLVQEFCQIPAKILDCLIAKGEYGPAVEFGGEILQHFPKIFQSDDHSDMLSTKSGIAESYLKHGMCDDAQRLYQEIFDQQRKKLGENHPDTLKTQRNIDRSFQQLAENMAPKSKKRKISSEERGQCCFPKKGKEIDE